MKYFLGSILSAEGGMHCPGVSNKYMKTNENSLDPLVILVELWMLSHFYWSNGSTVKADLTTP